MKLKLKLLAAAVTLAVAGTANATIDDFNTGDGSLFLSVRDNTNGQSIVLDMNTNLSTFMPTSTSAQGPLTFDNTDVKAFVAAAGGASANLSWAVMAGDSLGSSQVDGIHYLSTTKDSTITGMTGSKLGGMDLINTSYLANINSVITGDTMVSSNGDFSYFTPDADTWEQSTTFSATAGVDQSMNFFMLSNSVASGGFADYANSAANIAQYAGTWKLDNQGVLSYSTVPVPPAIWLMGSALMGLVGVARRKNQNV